MPSTASPPAKKFNLTDYIRGLKWGKWTRQYNGAVEMDMRYCRITKKADRDLFWKVWRANTNKLRKWGLAVRYEPDNSGRLLLSFAKPLPEEELKRREGLFIASSIHEDVPDEEFDFPFPEGLSLRPYQKRGAMYSEMCSTGVLIADDMGLGKTIQALVIANKRLKDAPEKGLLIICPASLKGNWKREGEKWLTIPELRDDIDIAQGSHIPSSNVVVINYDIIKRHEEALLSREWGMVVMDEAHVIKNTKAKRSKTALKIKADFSCLLTGTPMDKAPKELWNLIHYINPKDWHLKSVFTDRYCGGRAARGEGADRTEELNRRLRETGMVRRLKTEVLKELPAKVRQLVTVNCVDGMPTAGSVEDLIREASDKIKELEAKKAKSNDEDHQAIVAEMNLTNFGFMSDMMKVRKQIGLAKVPGVSQSISEVLDAYPDKKIILFGIHTEVIAAYESNLARFNPVTISGKTPVKTRQSLVDKFQEDESCRLFIGNITAAGVGLTLTRSDHVVMAEQEWGPAKMVQAEDRCILEGQPVMTPSGWVPIEELSVGDEVITHTGRISVITDVWSKSCRKDVVELEVAGWKPLVKVTHDHRIMSDGKWVDAEDLKPGSIIDVPRGVEIDCLSLPKPFSVDLKFQGSLGYQSNGRLVSLPSNIDVCDELLFTAGYYIGDGFCRTDNSESSAFVSLAGHKIRKKAHLERCSDYLEGLTGLKMGEEESEVGYNKEIRIHSKELAHFFSYYFGRICREKKVPQELLNLPLAKSRVLLSGLMASDGYYRNGRYEYVTVNRNLAANVSRIIANAGYRPMVSNQTCGAYVVAYSEEAKKGYPVRSSLRRHGKKNERVYDLTIEDDSSFIVALYPVHNCHRIGQENSVLIQVFAAEDSIDVHIAQLIIEKTKTVEACINGSGEVAGISLDDVRKMI